MHGTVGTTATVILISSPIIPFLKTTMSGWAIPVLKQPRAVGWKTSSVISPREGRFSDASRPKVRCALGRRLWDQGTHLPCKHYSQVSGARFPSFTTTREGCKRNLKLTHRVSPNFPNGFHELLDDGGTQESVELESSTERKEEPRTPKSRFTPFCSNFGIPGRRRLLMNNAFAGSYEREIIRKEIVRMRLNSVGSADTVASDEEFYRGSRTQSDSCGPMSFGYRLHDAIVFEMGRYGQLGREQECKVESNTPKSSEIKERRMPLKTHEGQGRWARRRLLNHCIPAIILERLGLNFSFKNFFNSQGLGLNQLYDVDVTVSYEMRNRLASEGGPQPSQSSHVHPSETGEHFLTHDGRLPYLTTDSMKQARPVNFSTSSRSNNGANINSFRSNQCSAVLKSRRPGVGKVRRSPRRLWLQAHVDLDPPQSTMWRDMFTILGLGAFIISGTYAFAVSNRYLKFGSKNRCISTTVRNPCSKPSCVIELTNCNFETSVSKKPTFVLFYAPWCAHCKQLEHTWKVLSCRLPQTGFDVQLAQMDAEKYSQLAEKYEVVKYPTLIFFKDGKATENHSGPRDVDSLMKFIDQNYSP